MIYRKRLGLQAALIAICLVSSHSALAGKFSDLFFSTYGGFSQSQASGFGLKEVRDGSVEPRSSITAGTGLLLGTHWFDRLSTEFRIISMEGFTASSAGDQFRQSNNELAGSSSLRSDLRLNEVSALYYFGQKGSLDHYSQRNRISPFVRLGLGNLNTDSSEFGLFTDGDDYLTVGAGVDMAVFDRVGLRAEVNALHADYLFGTISFVIGFN